MKKLTTNDFISKAKLIHGDRYDYSNTIYTTNKDKLTIICQIHGEFEQTPNAHLSGKGCPNCGETLKLNTDLFIEKAKTVHNNFYDYTLVTYKTSKEKVLIYCPIHGGFEQQPDSHLQGIGCPNCSASKGELAISNFLVKNNIHFKQQHKFDNCKYKNLLKFDFYLPKENILIEYDGIQHYKETKQFGGEKAFQELKTRDAIKTKFAQDNNIPLLRIPYTEFNNIENIISSFILERTDDINK